MSQASLGLPADIQSYLLDHGVREPEVLVRLREETSKLAAADMQIAAEQGALMALLVRLMGARRCIELGTFTGYSSLAVALALPDDGQLICCDVSEEWTAVARRYWEEVGVAHKIDLRLGQALTTLEELVAQGEQFDFAFLDADKENYPAYYELLVSLVRSGGLIAIDNVFWGGEVAGPGTDPALRAVKALNDRVIADDRVAISMVPIADGLTLALVL